MTSEFSADAAGIARSGAASDAADDMADVSALPRVMRYAVLGLERPVRERIAAEIAACAEDLAAAAAGWCEGENPDWQALAAVLDGRAVAGDNPTWRSLADAVRLESLCVPLTVDTRADAERVALALHACMADDRGGRSRVEVSSELRATCERITIGWAALASGYRHSSVDCSRPAHPLAHRIGVSLTYSIEGQAQERVRAEYEERARVKREMENAAQATAAQEQSPVPRGHVLVCPPIGDLKSGRLRELSRGHEHAIGRPLPLRPTPDLAEVRARLVLEFPYAERVIDRLLRPLVGRETASFPPALLVGPPGCGKSRLGRRFGELLGAGPWRFDASRADGAIFAGTDRRWFSSEPAHPFLAVSALRIANPVILIDETEKSGTRSDYGRFWDCVLAFLEPETAARYPDPALQVALDLSHVSYVATANSVASLPGPFLDRFRVIEVPEPRLSDLDRLLGPALADLAAEWGQDPRWVASLTAPEREVVRRAWRGGSVRRLRRILDGLVQARERLAIRH